MLRMVPRCKSLTSSHGREWRCWFALLLTFHSYLCERISCLIPTLPYCPERSCSYQGSHRHKNGLGWETWQKQLLQSLGKQYAQCLGSKMMCKPDNNLYRLIMIKMTLQYHTIHYHPFKIIIKLKQFWGLIRIISEEKAELPELISVLLWWKFPSLKSSFLKL